MLALHLAHDATALNSGGHTLGKCYTFCTSIGACLLLQYRVQSFALIPSEDFVGQEIDLATEKTQRSNIVLSGKLFGRLTKICSTGEVLQ